MIPSERCKYKSGILNSFKFPVSLQQKPALTEGVLGLDAVRRGKWVGGALLVDGLHTELVVFSGHQAVDVQLRLGSVRLSGTYPPTWGQGDTYMMYRLPPRGQLTSLSVL